MDYKGNSHKSKEETTEKKIEKVVTGKVNRKKKGEIRKFADVFITEDIANVKSYIVGEVLIPAAKKALSDIVSNGIDMLLYGESGASKRRNSNSRVSYTNYYERDRGRNRDRDRDRESYSRVRSAYNFDDIILDDRGEAEDVLSRMDDLIEAYGMVSVADLNDLVGITGSYTDNKYGWTNLRDASILRVREGYMLKLPRTKPL